METNTDLTTDHFLVYGTLRPGCGNYNHFFPYVSHSVKTVRIPGFAMYGVRGFPYAVRATAEDSIECSMITVNDTAANVAMLQEGLDALEGYNPKTPYSNHYDRITVDVEGEQAHLYVASDFMRDRHILGGKHPLPRLDSGNWYEVSPPTDGAYVLSDIVVDDEGAEVLTIA